jgi:hypothetical protein
MYLIIPEFESDEITSSPNLEPVVVTDGVSHFGENDLWRNYCVRNPASSPNNISAPS